MRKIATDVNYDDEDPTIGWADWKESPENVLDVIDGLLEPYGLEVVLFDIGDDNYFFKIEKRQP